MISANQSSGKYNARTCDLPNSFFPWRWPSLHIKNRGLNLELHYRFNICVHMCVNIQNHMTIPHKTHKTFWFLILFWALETRVDETSALFVSLQVQVVNNATRPLFDYRKIVTWKLSPSILDETPICLVILFEVAALQGRSSTMILERTLIPPFDFFAPTDTTPFSEEIQ